MPHIKREIRAQYATTPRENHGRSGAVMSVMIVRLSSTNSLALWVLTVMSGEYKGIVAAMTSIARNWETRE